MKKLALLRHTKSSWDNSTITDFERPLSSRGKSAAPLMGNEIKRLRIKPNIILCSSSSRTRETLELSSLQNTIEAEKIYFEDELYLATSDILLKRINSLSNDISTALIIGHNPGLQNLILTLVGHDSSNRLKKIKEHFPTGSLALIDFHENDWRKVKIGAGNLTYFSSPRHLKD